MAQTKEKENTVPAARAKQNAAAAPAAAGEKRPRTTRRPYYNRRPRRPQQPKEAATPIHIYPLGGLGEVVYRHRSHAPPATSAFSAR